MHGKGGQYFTEALLISRMKDFFFFNYFMLAFYNKLMGTVVKPRVERRGWSVEARA